MFRILLYVYLGLGSAFAYAMSIEDVFKRSGEARLQNLPLSQDDARIAVLQRDFEMLIERRAGEPLELRVVRGPLVIESVAPHTVVMHESVADAAPSVRMFLLAHEVGHLRLEHHLALVRLYKEYIPGEVVPEVTDAVPPALGRRASLLSHEHEYAADKYAFRYIQELGYSLSDMMVVFQQFGMQFDTATHLGTRKRLAHLRQLEASVLP